VVPSYVTNVIASFFCFFAQSNDGDRSTSGKAVLFPPAATTAGKKQIPRFARDDNAAEVGCRGKKSNKAN
jgi:hypothetical protein